MTVGAPAGARGPGLGAVPVIIGYALRESLRRRVFVVVLLLTAGFLGLYGLAVGVAHARIEEGSTSFTSGGAVDTSDLAGATLFGMAMFSTLFLGAVLAVFLTLGVVRGDAERGLLQPLVVRPVGRSSLLLARFLAAAAVCAAYVAAVFFGALLITRLISGWWPDRVLVPALGLMAAVAIIAALSLLGSVFLTATANGIAVFMAFGAGLVAGLLGQIGEAIDSPTLRSASRAISWALPFEALYQAGLSAITADARGITRIVVQLGPFGGAHSGGPLLALWAVAYLVGLGLIGMAAFRRKDL
jgi:ABC-type transport system involved in multi-copper enzyme maturation permease subunit